MATYSMQHMYIVRSIVGVCVQAGGVATSTVVLPKIFTEVLPTLLSLLVAAPVQPDLDIPHPSGATASCPVRTTVPVLAALLEVISLLIGLLPVLSPEIIRRYFFGHSKRVTGGEKSSSASAVSDRVEGRERTTVLTILNRLPLPRLHDIIEQNRDSDDSFTSTATGEPEHFRNHTVQACIEFRQRHSVHIELCRLIGTAATYAGPRTAVEYVLPAVNSFFDSFVLTYETLDVESDEMSLAFEIGVELFFPLAQLVGPEAFSTAVPHLNPRLEMWLVSSASGEVGRSPPLPGNILPAEQSSGNSDEIARPVKDKGFFSWLTSRGWAEDSSPKVEESEDSFFVMPTNFVGNSLDSIKKSATGIFSSDSGGDVSPIAVESEMNPVGRSTSTRQRKVSIRSTSSDSIDAPPSRSAIARGGIPMRRPSGGKTSFHPDASLTDTYFSNLSLSNTRTSSQSSRRKSFRRSSVGTLFSGKGDAAGEDSSDEEVGELFDQMQSDMAWLLGGEGRWNSVREFSSVEGAVGVGGKGGRSTAIPVATVENSSLKMKMPAVRSISSSGADQTVASTIKMTSRKAVPAAQISMTSPRVTVDTASEASALFGLKMINRTSWPFDNYPAQSTAQPSSVSLLVTNPTESFLLGGAKDGLIKIWSLSAHPVRQLSTYREHTDTIMCANFMRSGSHVASCDGNIHIWDVETSKTMAALQFSYSQVEKFTHITVKSARSGIMPDMGTRGDDQLAACSGSVLSHYDFRMPVSSSLRPISEWRMPLPTSVPTSGEPPSQLTCSASHEEYVCAGSSSGMLWVFDRRTGRPTHMWQGHDAPIIKVHGV